MKRVRQSDRSFGFTLSFLFGLLSFLGWLVTGVIPTWAVCTALGFAVLAIVAPGVLMPLNCFWAWIAPKIATINNTIVLALVFYLFIAPIGVIMRLCGRDPMHRTLGSASCSYWTPVRRRVDGASFQDQF